LFEKWLFWWNVMLSSTMVPMNGSPGEQGPPQVPYWDPGTDSDGDVWYKLEAVNTGAFDPHPRRFKERRTLSSAMNDSFEPAALGRWLAARTGMPYTEP